MNNHLSFQFLTDLCLVLIYPSGNPKNLSAFSLNRGGHLNPQYLYITADSLGTYSLFNFYLILDERFNYFGPDSCRTIGGRRSEGFRYRSLDCLGIYSVSGFFA